jgi:hypothetical protein
MHGQMVKSLLVLMPSYQFGRNCHIIEFSHQS